MRLLGAVYARLRRWFRRGRELFPFTWLGSALVAGAAVAAFLYGIKHIDLILLVVGLVGLGVALITMLTTVTVSIVLWAKLRKRAPLDPLQAECGHVMPTGFQISNLWFVPFVEVVWTWETPAADVRATSVRRRFIEEIRPTRRCLTENVVRRFDVSDVFGFTRVTFRVTEARAVKFVPSMGALRSIHVVRSISGGQDLSHPDGPPEGERMDMRPYVTGDPIRYVLWKVYAKSRALVVRTPERAISPVRQTVAYLVTGEGDEPAAGAARVAVESGALGGEWVFGVDGYREYAKTPALAQELLARSSSNEQAACGEGLGTFLAQATPTSSGRAVVFVPAKPGPWLDRVARAVRGRGSLGAVEFVVCADGITREEKAPAWKRLLLKKEDPEAARTAEIGRVVDTLAATRSHVLVVDRSSGRVLSQQVRFSSGTVANRAPTSKPAEGTA